MKSVERPGSRFKSARNVRFGGQVVIFPKEISDGRKSVQELF